MNKKRISKAAADTVRGLRAHSQSPPLKLVQFRRPQTGTEFVNYREKERGRKGKGCFLLRQASYSSRDIY